MQTTAANQPPPAREGRREGRGLVWFSRILFVLSLAMLLGGLILRFSAPFNSGGATVDGQLLVTIGIILANGIVATLILSRYPRHVVGWLLLAISFSAGLGALSAPFGDLFQAAPASATGPLTHFMAWVSLWAWFPMVLTAMLWMPLYFPDGRLLSRRWRIVALLAGAMMIIGWFCFAGHPGPFKMGGSPGINPYPVQALGPIVEIVYQTLFLPLGLILVAAVYTSVALRYRRAGSKQRAQMRWVLYTIGLGTALVLLFWLLGNMGTPAFQAFVGELSNDAVRLLTVAIPISVGIAILRQRLFDIDLIIRRTLIYGVVSAILAGIFFAGIVILQALFSSITGQESPVAIVISTLAIAALFNPLRRRVQELVDRRFYRAQYDAAQVMAQFNVIARDEVDLESLSATMMQLVEESMQPETSSLWLARREGDGGTG